MFDKPQTNYLDAAGAVRSAEIVPVFENTTKMSAGWYAVTEDVTVSDRINVSGDVHLILCDNATLIASKGIGVTGNNSLTVYAQSTGDSMGALIATGPISHARLYRSRRFHLQGVFRQWGDAYRRYADNAR